MEKFLVFRLIISTIPLRQFEQLITFDHSTFLMEGSSHSYHLALHCLGVFLTSNDDIRAHCYLVSAVCSGKSRYLHSFRISRSQPLESHPLYRISHERPSVWTAVSLPVLRQTPPLMMIRTCHTVSRAFGVSELYTPFLRLYFNFKARECFSRTCPVPSHQV